MKNKKNKLFIILEIITLVLIVTIGITYAFYSYSRTGTQNSQLVTGDIYMRYVEGSSINLSGAMPSNNYPTKATGNYFQFQITGKNTHTTNDISYTLKLAHGDIPDGKSSANRIADRWLYFKLVEVNNLGESNETETILVANANFTTIPNSIIYTGTIPANTTSVLTKTYRLYARIDYNLVIGNTANANYSESTWNNLFASIKVNASGEDFAPPPPPTIETCPDCVYKYFIETRPSKKMWNNLEIYTITDFTNDYTSLNSNQFLGATGDGNNKKIYVCGIENETPFCIEGYYSESKQINNINIMKSIFGENNCEEKEDSFFGNCYVCTGTNVTALTCESGEVSVRIDNVDCAVQAMSSPYNENGLFIHYCG